ncbi:hypothetical protein C8Q80DRAFT_1275014 [Daedaleopsis nitida]|nr:hypothetical protein C8Q80DRAFT_1275014 [Daedaleopsis nitida]
MRFKLVQHPGIPLLFAIWGESDKEDFALLWKLAVYKMSLLIVSSPRSVTLLVSVRGHQDSRPDPLYHRFHYTSQQAARDDCPSQHTSDLIDAAAGFEFAAVVTSPVKLNGVMEEDYASESDEGDILSEVLQEVDLVQGLARGTLAAHDVTPRCSDARVRPWPACIRHHRKNAMHGPWVAHSTGVTSPRPGGTLPRAAPLRKSSRKSLKTNIGIRVRMRAVFVPGFVLRAAQSPPIGKIYRPHKVDDPGAFDLDSDLEDDILEERDIEVENLFPGASAPGEASSHFERRPVRGVVWPREQVNLLYAVSFLRGLDVDEFVLARTAGGDEEGVAEEVRRVVSIRLMVRLYWVNDGWPSYLTRSFPSRWNCMLDGASSSDTQRHWKMDTAEFDDTNREYFVLPPIAEPFSTAPLALPLERLPRGPRAAFERHTIAAFDTPTKEYARMPGPRSPTTYDTPTCPPLPLPPTDSSRATHTHLSPTARVRSMESSSSRRLAPIAQQSGPGTVVGRSQLGDPDESAVGAYYRRPRHPVTVADRRRDPGLSVSTPQDAGGEAIVVSVGLGSNSSRSHLRLQLVLVGARMRRFEVSGARRGREQGAVAVGIDGCVALGANSFKLELGPPTNEADGAP